MLGSSVRWMLAAWMAWGLAFAEGEEHLRELVARLVEGNAAAREEAQVELERLGTAPEAALKEALKRSEDPEAKTRIGGLLEAIRAEHAAFEAIPPERLAELSPLVHAFHAEWTSHQQETSECRCVFDSIRTLACRGSAGVEVLAKLAARVHTSIGSTKGWTSYPPPHGGATIGLLRSFVPPMAAKEAPGLDELGPFYADLIADPDDSPFMQEDLVRALSEQRSLGAATALVAWVHSKRAVLRGELTGGCTGDAAPLYNRLMSVQRALEENGDLRLVPLLVELLDEEDQSREFAHIEGPFTVPSPTHLAIEVLRKLTAQELPYDGLSADRAARAQAIAAWRDWYEKHKAEFVR